MQSLVIKTSQLLLCTMQAVHYWCWEYALTSPEVRQNETEWDDEVEKVNFHLECYKCYINSATLSLHVTNQSKATNNLTEVTFKLRNVVRWKRKHKWKFEYCIKNAIKKTNSIYEQLQLNAFDQFLTEFYLKVHSWIYNYTCKILKSWEL